MADWKAGSDFLGAVLQKNLFSSRRPDRRGDARSIAAIAGPRYRSLLCLQRAITTQAPVTGQFGPDSLRVAVEQFGDLVLFMACATENINLLSFVLGQMGVDHWATSTWRLMGQNAHAFYPFYTLIKIALQI